MSFRVLPMDNSKNNAVLSVFSSISKVASSLVAATSTDSPHPPIQIIQDEALSGYGGTTHFDAAALSKKTRQQLSEARILVTEPEVLAKLLLENPQALPRLEWCQSTYAGVDPLFAALEKNPGDRLDFPFRLTRFAGKFGPPIAEWCLARIIGHERSFAATARNQTLALWGEETQDHDSQQQHNQKNNTNKVTEYRYLADLTLVILGGAGDIGRCIGKAAKAFGMRVVAFGQNTRRSVNDLQGSADLYVTDLSTALSMGDYIVSILPSTPHTRGLLNASSLACVKRGAVWINVGRGDVMEEQDLIGALDKGVFQAAILDVFSTEPLPKESPLWSRPDVVVSPHVSGVTRASDVPAVMMPNYHRFREGRQLLHEIDWSKGY